MINLNYILCILSLYIHFINIHKYAVYYFEFIYKIDDKLAKALNKIIWITRHYNAMSMRWSKSFAQSCECLSICLNSKYFHINLAPIIPFSKCRYSTTYTPPVSSPPKYTRHTHTKYKSFMEYREILLFVFRRHIFNIGI